MKWPHHGNIHWLNLVIRKIEHSIFEAKGLVMKSGTLLLKLSHRRLLLSCLFVAILATACGTLQVDLAPTLGPVVRPGVPLTPTPWFGPAQFATEAGVVFDDRLKLVGFTVEPDSAGPGAQVTVTLIWQVLDKILADYNTFVHIVNDEDQLLAQSDAPTGGGYRLSTDWIINEYVYDQHHLALPNSISLSDVEIRIGLYDFDGNQRLDVESPGSYTIQTVASPTPEKPTSEVTAPTATETPYITPQIKETEATPPQDALQLRLAYVKDQDIWIWHAGAEPVRLTQNGGVDNVWLSDDGQLIAFTRDQSIWVIDSDGGNERRLTTEEDFQGLDLDQEMEPYVTGINPSQVAWRPDSHQLYFNTSPQIDGPGLLLSDDLWMVDVDSEALFLLLSPGEGGKFYFSPDGRSLAIVTPGRIDLMETDGNNRREAFTHTPVITYSEFEYYAQPVWAADSGSLRVAIPPADFLAAAIQPTSIWHIPVEDQPARLIGEVTTHSGLNRPLSLAPDFNRLAYLVGDQPENRPESNQLGIGISEMSESKIWDPVVYEAEILNVFDWSPDGMRLLLTTPSANVAEIVMGQPAIKSMISDEDKGTVANLTWTDNFRFLYAEYSGDGWNLLLGHVDRSDPELIDSGPRLPVSFDFTWVPVKTAEQ